MKKALIVLLVAGSAALSAWAQAPQNQPKVVGKLIKVEGLVTVSSGQSLANAVNDAKLIVGSRIVTTSSGFVTLNFDNGCDIRLEPNQSVTVEDSNNCAAILAAVQTLPVVAAAGAGAGLLVPALILVGGGLAIAGGGNSTNNTSPN